MKHGFIKAAAAAPIIKVADTDFNADRIIETLRKADRDGIRILVFPELSVTGCSCYDLMTHRVLLKGAEQAVAAIIEASAGANVLTVVGLPYAIGSRIYSCAAVLCSGSLLGIVPRENVRGSAFSAFNGMQKVLFAGKYEVPFSADLLFTHNVIPGLKIAVELGADLCSIHQPAYRHAAAGATVIAQLAGYPETVSSMDEAVLDARFTSKRLRCGILSAAPGKGESTTDNAFSGLCLAAEDGAILAQSEAKEPEDVWAVTELDIDRLINARTASGEFDAEICPHTELSWGGVEEVTSLTRAIRMHPHLPETPEALAAYCERMIDIQVSGLAKRMSYASLDHCVVGISGGVDSTLAVMVSAMAVKRLGLPAENVVACTMPCFGTSSRTKSNAIIVAEQLGAEVRVIDIGKSVYQHFDDIGHAHDDYSIAFENAQARERTQILMDIANKVNGLDVGTEDLSEFVDGWCTYNGDHTSMYDVNLGLTKTQVRANVRYIAERTEDKVLAAALWDVLDCPVTPELLPIENDEIIQKSEDSVGSYSLQDFFTYCMLIHGFTPEKTMRLAQIAYRKEFTDEELVKWLTSYCKRLFSQQFKRSCLMDGPAVEAFTVSPRTGYLIPSDAENALFLRSVENIRL